MMKISKMQRKDKKCHSFERGGEGGKMSWLMRHVSRSQSEGERGIKEKRTTRKAQLCLCLKKNKNREEKNSVGNMQKSALLWLDTF
jgi:hypothetical protein